MDGTGSYETHELVCVSGGRPAPEIVWAINRQELQNNNVFQIRDGKGVGSISTHIDYVILHMIVGHL